MDFGCRLGQKRIVEDVQPFRLRYVGARFDGRRMPLDVLPDLPAFRDLLVSYVKEAWLKGRSNRERVPKGFVKSLKFDLVGIDDGSAVPTIAWDRNNALRQLPDFKDEMEILVEAAYDRAVALVGSSTMAQNARRLTPTEFRALNSFGSGLLSDERIEFVGRKDVQGNVIFLDAGRRRHLLTRGRDSYAVRFDSVGKLLGSHIDETNVSGSVDVHTAEYGTLVLKISPDRVETEFDGSMRADVQFRLMIELDRAAHLKAVSEIIEIDLMDLDVVADLERCRKRLDALASLLDGWHDGTGKAPTSRAVSVAMRLLARNPGLANSYRIYPTLIGGLLFEFSQDGWDYSIEIGPDGMGEIFGVEEQVQGEMESGVLDIDDETFRRMFEVAAGGRW